MACNIMSQHLSVLGGVHPLKWVGHPLKCDVRPQKSLLSVIGLGSV